jgi:phosphatidylserine/phosphatidylglycerophosphate/cardiolipin synthase-like enzyme
MVMCDMSAEAVQTSTAGAKAVKPGIRRGKKLAVLACLFLLYVSVAWYQSSLKTLEPGLSLAGEPYRISESNVEFLNDQTYMKNGLRVSDQEIFDRVLKVIHEAQNFIFVDFFLYNDYLGREHGAYRKLSEEVTQALIDKVRQNPSIRIMVISDPLNVAYGGSISREFGLLRQVGIPVVITRLDRLRDSNPAYSAFWRMFVQWFGVSRDGLLPHPLGAEARVGFRAWLALFNFKANHRKLIVADCPGADDGRQMTCMVMSANPHDGSSAHNNIALQIRGGLWQDLVRSEQAVLKMSGSKEDLYSWLPDYAKSSWNLRDDKRARRTVTARIFTESRIREEMLQQIDSIPSGGSIDVAMFYLSERQMIEALLRAAGRGVIVRVLLDPNRDAFGYKKNGMPNRPVAAELVERSQGKISVRWFYTHGEQFHTKMVVLKNGKEWILWGGSANLTRRNLGDFNLETDVMIAGDAQAKVLKEASDYFEGLWSNPDHAFSVPYEALKVTGIWMKVKYRFQEWSGISTF